MTKPTARTRWVNETFHADWQVRLKADRVLHEVKSKHQHLVIFENATWGTVLMLDGVTQLTTADEFMYHEMMAHVPLMALEKPRDVLVIGGGDGGVLREVLKHGGVKRATLVDIDREVIDTALKYFPQVSDGAFDDPRSETVIADGVKFIAETDRRFDAIIVDSSEPIGPSAVLHGKPFFTSCRNALKPGGILIAQNGLIFSAPEHLEQTTSYLAELFPTVAPYTVTQPCYFGGALAINAATDGDALTDIDVATLSRRAKRRKVETRYWTPDVHAAAFALPAYAAAVRDKVIAKNSGARRKSKASQR
ncbi:MAG: polyamine aminopropyltransferase [Pseudomonadota bacterium]